MQRHHQMLFYTGSTAEENFLACAFGELFSGSTSSPNMMGHSSEKTEELKKNRNKNEVKILYITN